MTHDKLDALVHRIRTGTALSATFQGDRLDAFRTGLEAAISVLSAEVQRPKPESDAPKSKPEPPKSAKGTESAK